MNGQAIEILDVLDLTKKSSQKISGPKGIIKSDAFEKRRFPYLYLFPLMWGVIIYVLIKKTIFKLLFKSKPKTNSLFFDGLGPWSRKVKDGAASWRALDIIYNHPFERTFSLRNLVDEFWWFSQNCQAVRNRFKLVKREAQKALLNFAERNDEVRIVSLACGSAQAIIETISELRSKNVRVKALLIDIEQDALNYAKGLAEENGVTDSISFVKANACQTARILREFNPHIVEMLGLLDYLPKISAVRLISSIRKSLAPGGMFLTCNIHSNSERYFVKWVIDWEMVYRSPDDLSELMEKSGFDDYRIVYEPLKIHGVVISKKTTTKA